MGCRDDGNAVLSQVRQVCHGCRLAGADCPRLRESPCRQRELLRAGELICPRGMFEAKGPFGVTGSGVVITRQPGHAAAGCPDRAPADDSPADARTEGPPAWAYAGELPAARRVTPRLLPALPSTSTGRPPWLGTDRPDFAWGAPDMPPWAGPLRTQERDFAGQDAPQTLERKPDMLTNADSKEAVSMDKIALRAVAVEQPSPNAGHRLTVSVSRYGQLPDGRKVFGSDVRTLRIPDLEKLAADLPAAPTGEARLPVGGQGQAGPAESEAAAPILTAVQALADAVGRYASAKGVI